jgi:tetratricopeptide (TPR) repeat protein
LIEAGKWEEAVALYTTGLEKVDKKAVAKLKNARVGLFLNWADKAAQKGEFETAIDILKKGTVLEPKDPNILNNTLAAYDAWSNKYMEKVDWARAIRVYEKGLIHLPGNSHLKGNLAYCKQEQAKH